MNRPSVRLLPAAPAAFLLLAFVVSAAAQSEAPRARADEKPAKPAPSTGSGPADEYAGRTVKTTKDGYGLIRVRGQNAPKVGQVAPDFQLKTADGKKTVKLSGFRGKKPVVLVFGSFT